MSSMEQRQPLGELIRLIRKASGGTQLALSLVANISPQYWNDIESGRRIPPPDTLVRIEEALNVPTPTLLWAWVRLHVGDETADLMLATQR